MLEEPRVTAERRLAGPGAIERLLKALGGGKRQDDAGHHRNGPETDRHPAGYFGGDKDPQRPGEREDNGSKETCLPAEEIGPFGPGEEPVDLVLPGTRGEHAVGVERQAPVIERRQLRDCVLTLDHLRAR